MVWQVIGVAFGPLRRAVPAWLVPAPERPWNWSRYLLVPAPRPVRWTKRVGRTGRGHHPQPVVADIKGRPSLCFAAFGIGLAVSGERQEREPRTRTRGSYRWASRVSVLINQR